MENSRERGICDPTNRSTQNAFMRIVFVNVRDKCMIFYCAN